MRPEPTPANPPLEIASETRTGAVSLTRDLWDMAKPRLTALVVMTTGVGYWLGFPAARSFELRPFFATLFGTALVAASASVLNQWREREYDRWMVRTADRPLATGRLGGAAAGAYALLAGFGGLSLLCIESRHIAAGLALATLVLYVLVYTPLKRMHSLNTIAGAVPGAIPPLIGWAAATGGLTTAAWSLALVVFLWQVPHFLAIAFLYKDDYARAGFRMLPTEDPGAVRTGRIALIYAVALLPAGIFPAMVGLGGPVFAAGAAALGVWFISRASRFERERTRERARGLFFGSLIYLPTLLLLLCLDPTTAVSR